MSVQIEPVTKARLDDLADLFQTNATTRGCWCVWFMSTGKQRQEGWGTANRERFEAFASRAKPPAGLLAYKDGVPVGWCATGPRSRYPAAIGPRAQMLKARDPAEDDDVWLVPCFFVRVGYRRAGVTDALLKAAVALAEASGATAIEGFPLAEGAQATDGYLGKERQFERCGFTCIARPSPRRAVMRRELSQRAARARK
jgi:GNAT superfamily N-acetyltransferase